MSRSFPRRVLRNQLGLARALWWAVRGREDVGSADTVLRSSGLDRAVLWTISVLGLLEIGVVHVLVSWPALRWSLFGVGIYGLLAFLAFSFTVDQHPHLMRNGELVLRFGHFHEARVPLDHLVAVRKHVDNAHEKNVALDDAGLVVAFMGGTNVELRFSPDAVATLDSRGRAVSRVSFFVDDPGAAVALLRAHAPAPER
jgi:hypothetical protein